jgi:sugar O-acyltransferase (sialic acid O-acetyltransferase NeuD family)
MNIYGASGHGKVVIDIINSLSEKIDNILDDDRSKTRLRTYTIVHDLTPEVLKEKTIVAIGDNVIRKEVVKNFPGSFFPAVIHKTAVVDSSVKLGEGTVIMANASINSDAIIADHCILNTGCIVEHDCILDNFVHISPGATLAGGVRVGEGTHIGIGAQVIPGIKIGQWCTIGAGTIVLDNIPDGATVVGNPGRIIKIAEKENE